MKLKWEPPHIVEGPYSCPKCQETTVPKIEGYCECLKCGHKWMQGGKELMQSELKEIPITTSEQRAAKKYLTNRTLGLQENIRDIDPEMIMSMDIEKRLFLESAEIMINHIGFKATILLLTENFLDEEEPGRSDGLIDLPVK